MTGGAASSSQSRTTRITSAVPSMPIFTASTATSEPTASSWARTTAAGTGWLALTPRVFCTTTEVITFIP